MEEETEIVAAKVGDIIAFDNMEGLVEKVNENSVIVDITINAHFDEHEMFEKTVVNHKRYEVVQES